MATHNQLEARRLRQEKELKKEELQEKARANRAGEKLKRTELVGKGTKGIVDTAFKTVAGVGALNDASWYNQFPELVRDAARISFNIPMGNTIPGPFNTATVAKTWPTNTIPGIFQCRWIPAIGSSTDNSDLSKAAAQNIYAFVRHANSGSRNYEASDLMMYLLAMDQAYSYHAFMCRVFGLINNVVPSNRYTINKLVESYGIDPNDLKHNLADFVLFINSYAAQLNSLYAPNVMSVYKRHYWMNLNVYRDKDVSKSQFYSYIQDSFGIYNDISGEIEFKKTFNLPMILNGTRVTRATSVQFPRDLSGDTDCYYTVEALKIIGQEILRGLLFSEDAGIMAGDILKAYGADKMFTLKPIPLDFRTEYIYSEEVLGQFMNIYTMQIPESSISYFRLNDDSELFIPTSNYNITQGEDGEINQGIRITRAPSGLDEAVNYRIPSNLSAGVAYANNSVPENTEMRITLESILLNTIKNNVSEDDVMINTRMMVTPGKFNGKYLVRANNDSTTAAKNHTYYSFVGSCGTEIPVGFLMYSINVENVAGRPFIIPLQTFDRHENVVGELAYILITQTALSKFDWHPPIHIITTVNSTSWSITEQYGYFQDIQNFATLHPQTLDNLHYAAVFSEFGIANLSGMVRDK